MIFGYWMTALSINKCQKKDVQVIGMRKLVPGGGPHSTLQPRGGVGYGFAIIATRGEGGVKGFATLHINVPLT